MKFPPLLVLAASPFIAQVFAQDPGPPPPVQALAVESAAPAPDALFYEGRVVFQVARGSIFLVKGAGLGPDDLVVAQPPYPSRLPETEDGTRIEIRSLESEAVFDAPVLHSWTFQTAGILPSAVPEGLGELRVHRGAAVSDPLEILVVNSNPAVFLTGFRGGTAAAQVYRSPSEQPLISLTGPARPGDTVILWATGLGPIDSDDNAPPVGSLRDDIRIRIAGQEIVPDYAGRAPGQPGLDQINFRLPADADLPNHCYVPFWIEVGDAGGSSATLSLGTETGACEHPWGLPEETLRRLDEGGSINIVDLHLSQVDVPESPVNPPGRSGLAMAMLASANRAAVDRSSPSYRAPQPRAFPWLRWFDSGEVCSGVFSFTSHRGGGLSPGPIYSGRPLPSPDSRPLQAGDVTLTGPERQSFVLEPSSFLGLPVAPPLWTAEPSPDEMFPTPGPWTFRVSGGPDLPPFDHAVVLPDVDAFPRIDALRRGEDRELTWDGSSFPETDRMTVTVSVITERGENSHSGSGFSCILPARSGELVLPGSSLADLPDGLDGEVLWTVSLNRGDGEHVFEAASVDYATWSYGFSRSGTASLD